MSLTKAHNRMITGSSANVLDFGAIGDGSTDDLAAFNAAGATGLPVYVPPENSYSLSAKPSGSFWSTSSVTIAGAGRLDYSNVSYPFVNPSAPRNVVQYRNAGDIYIRDKYFPMGGFRFHGQYQKTNVPTFSSVSQQTTVSRTTDLAFGMSSDVKENWYAVFAVANDGDANCTFEIVPFLRADSVATDTITLRKAGENVHTSTPQTYTWGADALNGADILVITETKDSRANAFSGRTTTVTDSTTTTITLDDIGAVAAADWLLPAPLGYDHYRYCCSFYIDTSEVRNIADSGRLVKTRGSYDQSGTNTGLVSSFERREPGGNICPLATAVYFRSTCQFSTASTGNYNESFAIDTSHDVSGAQWRKLYTSSDSFGSGEIYVPFSFGPQYYFKNSGTLASARSLGQQNLYGWLEP